MPAYPIFVYPVPQSITTAGNLAAILGGCCQGRGFETTAKKDSVRLRYEYSLSWIYLAAAIGGLWLMNRGDLSVATGRFIQSDLHA